MSLFLPAFAVWAATIAVAVGARRLRPAAAAIALSVLAAASAVAAAGALAAVLAARIGHTPILANPLGWCLEVAGSWPTQVGAFTAVAGFGSAVWNVGRLVRTERRGSRRFGPHPLVVVEEADPVAFALAGRDGGQVVVSTGMLAALAPEERAALFAHERAHLRHRHHLLLRVTGLAAAAFPPLRPLRRIVRHATELWADESAAAEVGDRGLVASALAHAALAASPQLPPGALAFGDGGVADRVTVLLDDPARRPAWTAAASVAAAAATLLSLTQLHHVATLVTHLC